MSSPELFPTPMENSKVHSDPKTWETAYVSPQQPPYLVITCQLEGVALIHVLRPYRMPTTLDRSSTSPCHHSILWRCELKSALPVGPSHYSLLLQHTTI